MGTFGNRFVLCDATGGGEGRNMPFSFESNAKRAKSWRCLGSGTRTIDTGIKNGFLYLEAMISVMTALTEATIENDCLQVLKGSHKMQRFEHSFAGEQQGADLDFVIQAEKICTLVYVELNPGDVLFFHSNLLHRSAANTSDKSRWSIISAYNLNYNVPFREKNISCIQLITAVADNRLLESGIQKLNNADFLAKENEITLRGS